MRGRTTPRAEPVPGTVKLKPQDSPRPSPHGGGRGIMPPVVRQISPGAAPAFGSADHWATQKAVFLKMVLDRHIQGCRQSKPGLLQLPGEQMVLVGA